jgi:uncharacterized protein (TIGR03792 family)
MSSWSAVEQLVFEIPAQQMDEFFLADAQTWTPFLEEQAGYGGKMKLFGSNYNALDGNVTITNLIFWENYSAWKAIPSEGLASTYAAFAAAFAHPAPYSSQPSTDGWQLYENSTSGPNIGCVLSNTIGESMCKQQPSDNLPLTPLVDNNTTADEMHTLVIAISIALVLSICYIGYLHRKILQLKASFQESSSDTNVLHDTKMKNIGGTF